jgi:NADP-dependent 3-hydroxy acid dehydrogenase YdfG
MRAIPPTLRREVCGRGVRVSVLQPGLVRTGVQRKARHGPDFEERVRRWGTLLEPDEVAAAILWILSLPSHVNVSELLVRPTRITPEALCTLAGAGP